MLTITIPLPYHTIPYHMGLSHYPSHGHGLELWPCLGLAKYQRRTANGHSSRHGPRYRYPWVRVGRACGPRKACLGGARDAKVMLTMTTPMLIASSSEYRYDPRGFQWVGGSAPHINITRKMKSSNDGEALAPGNSGEPRPKAGLGH